MSESKPPLAPEDPGTAVMIALNEMNRVFVEQRAREAARVASLSPQQRAQEEQARIERAWAEKTRDFAKGIGEFAPHIPKLEALSAADFAWLLAGAAPNGMKLGVILHTDVSAKQRDYLRVLDSCIGLTLHPIPGIGAGARFRPADLLRVAQEKKLGDHALLARLLGAVGRGPNVPAPVPNIARPVSAPVTDAVTAPPAQEPISKRSDAGAVPPKPISERSPEQVKKRRRKQFEEAIRPYLQTATKEPDGRLLLNVQIPELRSRLGHLETFWKDAHAKTFRRYAREHRPLIELRGGRPANKPTAPVPE